MKRLTLLATLSLLAGPAASTLEEGLSAIGALGQLNGQALACGNMSVASQAKELVIAHPAKTRNYGEVFEEQTNAAFLRQGKDHAECPTDEDFAGALRSLSNRLQVALPAPPPANQAAGR